MVYEREGISQLIQGYSHSDQRVLFESIDKHQSYLIFKVMDGCDLTTMGVRYICN
jgi:hypothetical protein